MHWVIQDNIFGEQFVPKLIEFLEKVNLPYTLVKAVPFSGEMIPEPVIIGPAVALGSYSFTNRAKKLWYPGSWTNENFDYRVWSKEWEEFILNKGEVYGFGHVPFQQKPFFFRPCADDKVFTGMVYDWGEYTEWRHKVINLADDNTTIELEEDTPVVVSEPKKIVEEYRFVIVEHRIVSGSLYKQGRVGLYKEVTNDQEELIEFVEKVIDKWVPAKVFCLDIALCDGKYYVLEMGNFNSAGLYHCDPQKIVMALEYMIEDGG